ncbi:hypothetical protein PUN28_008710 [Cardiocondyla obscurior]|uniref:Ribosomal protein L33 n=1 Tax=Cardiocondyla obscurior TaxID=286306 RepID=A0AAW2FZJ0_9HYME
MSFEARNSRGHGSWATSHWETARDQRIRAARFTTIKMRKSKRYVVFLFRVFSLSPSVPLGQKKR